VCSLQGSRKKTTKKEEEVISVGRKSCEQVADQGGEYNQSPMNKVVRTREGEAKKWGARERNLGSHRNGRRFAFFIKNKREGESTKLVKMDLISAEKKVLSWGEHLD